jgi:HK97 family phage prohead protease
MSIKKTEAANRSLLGYGVVKAAADGALYIEGFANKRVVDRGNEIIETDAWQLDNYKKNPVILYNHGMDAQLGGTPVGVATEVKPTKDGLFIKAKLSAIDDPMFKRIRGLVEERVLRAFSVGFNPIDTDTDKATGAHRITKAELFEVSIVGVPMNQDSLFELSGKTLQRKSVHQIKKEVLKRKGAWVAGMVHNRIFELQKNDQLERDTALEEIASMAGIEMDQMMDILAGNVTPIPEPVLVAFSEVLKMDLEKLKDLDAEDASVEGKEQDSDAEDSEDDSEEDSQDDKPDETKPDESGQTAAAKEEPKKDPKPEAAKPEEKPEDDSKKSFQDCVAAKIPKLIEDGMEQDQAVAVAITQCQEKSHPGAKPTKANYVEFFRVADISATKKQLKQSDQGEDVSKVTSTIPSAKTEAENNDFGSPYLDAIKQTNVMLGQLIGEIQTMSRKLDKAPVTVDAPAEEPKPEPKPSEEGKMEPKEDEMTEEEKSAYPVDDEEQVKKSLQKFLTSGKIEITSKAKRVAVYTRIVEKALELGIEVEINGSDSLSSLLPKSIQDKLRESHDNAEVKMLDSYRKRLENVKERLARLEA